MRGSKPGVALAGRWAPVAGVAMALMAMACLLALATRSYASDVRIVSVRFGWGGYWRPGEPCPVVVDVETRGGRLTGSLEVTASSAEPYPPVPPVASSQALEMLGATRQRRVLYMFPPLWLAYPGTTLAIAVRTKQGDRVVDRRVISAGKLHPLRDVDALLLVVSGDPYALNTVAGTPVRLSAPSTGQRQGELRVANATASELPDDVHGFQPARLVLLANAPIDRLAAGQARALADWVLSGGTLVVAGGAEYGRLRAPVLRGLLPVLPTGATVARRAIPAFGMRIPPATPVTAFRLAPNAHMVPGSGGMAAVAPVGLGRCAFLAFDPTSDPVRGLYQGRVWQALTPLSASEEAWRAFARGTYLLSTAGTGPSVALLDTVLGMGGVQLPPFWLVALYVCLYVVALGPVNYGLVRGLRRPELGWFTVPATILVFTLGCYAAGCYTTGGRLRLRRVTVVVAGGGARRAPAISYVGLFAPRQGRYNLQTDRHGEYLVPASGNPDWIQEGGLRLDVGERPGVVNAQVSMWSGNGYVATTMADLGGGLGGRFSASSAPGAGYVLRGYVLNRTGEHLKGCLAGLGGYVSNPFDIPTGRKAMVLGVSNPMRLGRSGDLFADARNAVLLQRLSGLAIVGPLHRKGPRLFVNGRPTPCEDVTLLAARVPCALPKGATP